MNPIKISFLLILLFIINPLFAFILTWFFLLKVKLTNTGVVICLLILSSYFGLLAFTQKSLADIDTDCIRYYAICSQFVGLSIKDALLSINVLELLNYVFMPLNAIVVSLTNNVQSVSFLWVFISYFFIYVSVWRLTVFFGCYSQKNFAKLLLLLTFGFVLFVQVSELLKQASAIAIFFYGFSLFLEKGINIRTLLCVFFSIGIHPSMFMFLPLFLYNYLPTKKLLIITLCITPIFVVTDPIELLFNMLPGGNYFSMIGDKYGTYSDKVAASPHYILIEILMFCMTLDLWRRSGFKDDKYTNVVLIYFILSFANYNNLISFLRFALFSHWLFALMLVRYLTIYKPNFSFSKVARIIVVIMFLLSTRFTLGRLGGGGYASTYMDNSIVKICTSNMIDYLSVDFDKNG